MRFYDNFLSLCNSIGRSPSRVVLEIGLKKSAVTRWKRGGMPSPATLKAIADYFDVQIATLTGDNHNKKLPASGGELSEDALDRELITRLCSLSAEELAKVDAFVQGLLAAR